MLRGQPVSVPWPVIASVTRTSRLGAALLRLEVTDVAAVRHVDAPDRPVDQSRWWQRGRVTGPGSGGGWILGIPLVPARPDSYRLGAELARHLPATILRL